MAEILSIGELLDLGGSASTAGLIPYSALEYSAQKITAISGTAIGSNVDSATVTAIVSSAVSGKADQSALDHCCSSMSSVVSSLETSVTSMSSVVSGLTGDYLEKSASSMFQPSGDYAYQSSLSSYLPGSASSQFAPSGDYAYNSALSAYQPSGDYAYNSALSGKLDASASSNFQPSGNYAFNSALSSKLDESAFTAYTASAPTGGHTYTGVDPIVVDNENDQISLSASSIYFDSSMRSYVSGGSGFVGVNGSFLSGVAHDTSLSGDGSEAYPLGVSNYVGQYSSPSATIDIDNAQGTLEATRYAIRHLPAVNLTGVLDSTGNYTALLDYHPSAITARSATLKFTDLSGATQFKVSGLTTNDTAVYRYIGSGTSVTIPSSISDLLFISGNSYKWTANVTLSAAAEPDRVEELLYISDRYVNTIVMHSAGYPYIVGLNKHPFSAERAYSSIYATHAGNCTYADSSISAESAYKAVSAQAALKYFTGPSSSDTAFISSKLDASASSDFLAASASSGFIAASASSDFYGTGNPSGFTNYLPNFGYDGSKISSIDGSAVAGGWKYTSPSGTVAIDNSIGTIENTNSALRVEEHVTAAANVASASASSDNPWNFTLSIGATTVPDNAILSFPSVYCYPPNTRSADPSQYGWLELRAYDENDQEVRSASSRSSVRINQLSSISIPLTGYSKFSVYYITNVGYFDVSSASAVVSFDVPGQTASSTSVKAMAWADMSNVSAWQSLTAWAVSQGWNP